MAAHDLRRCTRIKIVDVDNERNSGQEGLVIKLAVCVLSKKSLSNSRQCIDLQQSQSLFKCVVDIDLTSTSNDTNTARSKCRTNSQWEGLQKLDNRIGMETYDPSGNGFFSSMSIVTSRPTLDLNSFWASSIAFLTISLSFFRACTATLSSFK